LSEQAKNESEARGAGEGEKPDRSSESQEPTANPLSDEKAMDAQRTDEDNKIARARKRISEGYYDRDDVRRAIAEALIFVLSVRRD